MAPPPEPPPPSCDDPRLLTLLRGLLDASSPLSKLRGTPLLSLIWGRVIDLSAYEAGALIWALLLQCCYRGEEDEDQPRRPWTLHQPNRLKPPLPLDVAVLDRILRRCSEGEMPLETLMPDPFGAPWDCPHRNTAHIGDLTMRCVSVSGEWMEEKDCHDFRSFGHARRETLVEWLSGAWEGLDRDHPRVLWAAKTLPLLLERGAMVTARALSRAENLYDGDYHDPERIGHDLVVALVTACPLLLTTPRFAPPEFALDEATPFTLDHYAELTNTALGEEVLTHVVVSPDLYDAWDCQNYPGPQLEGALRTLAAKVRARTLRPAVLEPQLGVHYQPGGAFAKWWADFTDWQASTITKILSLEE